jgi:hypothetical protein
MIFMCPKCKRQFDVRNLGVDAATVSEERAAFICPTCDSPDDNMVCIYCGEPADFRYRVPDQRIQFWLCATCVRRPRIDLADPSVSARH